MRALAIAIALCVMCVACEGARPVYAVDGGLSHSDAAVARADVRSVDACSDAALVCAPELERVACAIESAGYTNVFCARPGQPDEAFARPCRYACVRDGACGDDAMSPSTAVEVIRCAP